MGNRASIEVEGCNQVLYLQWNGGLGSVEAFTKEAIKRYMASRYHGGEDEPVEIKDESFVFYLFSAIREFFDFCNDVGFRGRDTLSLYVCSSGFINDGDNGHYVIKRNGDLDTGQAFFLESNEYRNSSFESITDFYSQLEAALLNQKWEE